MSKILHNANDDAKAIHLAKSRFFSENSQKNKKLLENKSFWRAKNTVKKGKRFPPPQHFLLFTQYFQKFSFYRLLKLRTGERLYLPI